MLTLSGAILVVGAGCKQRGRGALHRLTSSDDQVISTPPPPTFGGKEATILKRLQTYSGEVPEFTEMTVLPGRGMSVVSIKAYLPGHGETELLDALSLNQIAAMMAGAAPSSQTVASIKAGGVFLAPYANPLTVGTRGKFAALPVIPDPDRVDAPAAARFGLLGPQAATQTQFNNMPDGSELKSTFDVGNFGGRWPGSLQLTVSTLLSGKAIDLVMTATNTGHDPVPVSMGWFPRFAFPGKDRAQVRLRLPMSQALQPYTTHSTTSLGEIKAESGFNIRTGKELENQELDETLVHLKPALFDNGPTVEIRDPAADYGLRIVAMSVSVNGIRVFAPADKNWVAISPVANNTDMSGKPLDDDKADDLMVTPGKTLQWRIRLELFAPSAQAKPAKLPSPFDPTPVRP